MGAPKGLPLGSPEQVSDGLQPLLAGGQLGLDGFGFFSGGAALMQPCEQLEAGEILKGGGDSSVDHWWVPLFALQS